MGRLESENVSYIAKRISHLLATGIFDKVGVPAESNLLAHRASCTANLQNVLGLIAFQEIST